ncbi:MAG: ATP-binding protein [Clostridia bacterium]|nr:ATP-binding protein [Clostridia bacterium]
MKLIERTEYLNRLMDLKGTPDIKIITGIRRCGKSQLMAAYIEHIGETDANANIISVDFMDLEFEELKEYHALHKYIKDRYAAGKNNYVFIDEVQLCDGFELAVNSLYSSHKFDIYITGSNAFLLSADLATLFTGRYIELHVFPFSFREYCTYYDADTGKNSALQDAFDDYVVKGGLAGSYLYNTEIDRATYIREVYETIVNRDLIQKYKISDMTVLGHLAEFLMDNVGNLTSPNKVSATLNSNNIATNHLTIGKYIKHLCSAFVFYDIKRYDIKGKKYLATSEKYYLADSGIRYSVLGTRNMDYGRVYENIVCLELIRRGYELYIGKLYANEIDFVAIKGSEKIYIQVSDDISNPDTFKREYEPLLKINDAYPKMIIARTRHEAYDHEGIKIIDLATWLMGM